MKNSDTQAETDSTEQTLSSDGGQKDIATGSGNVSSPFETLSNVEETRGDRYRKLIDEYVYAPLTIIRDDWRAQVGFFLLGIYLFMGTVGAYLVEPTATLDGAAYVQPFQTMAHPLGTDNMGRDLFSSTVNATRPILIMMFSGGIFVVTVGTIFGTVAGYKGGTVDTILSTITDVFINIPGLPLVIVLAVLFEPTHPVLLGILLTVASWAGLARAIRSQVLTLRSESFVEASRAMDVSTPRLIFKDILPHLMPYVVINLMNATRGVIFSAVGLYFLGVLPWEHANWGITLSLAYTGGAHYRPGALHWLLVPVVAILGISMGLILLGQSLDRVFNPRARARHMGADADDVDDEDDSSGTEMMRQV